MLPKWLSFFELLFFSHLKVIAKSLCSLSLSLLKATNIDIAIVERAIAVERANKERSYTNNEAKKINKILPPTYNKGIFYIAPL